MSDLKPCPFCGEDCAIVVAEGRLWIECADCPHKVVVGPFNTEAEVNAAWNTRADTTKDADIARMREALWATQMILETIDRTNSTCMSDVQIRIVANRQALATDQIETSGYADCENTVVGDHSQKTSLGGGNTVISVAAKETGHDA